MKNRKLHRIFVEAAEIYADRTHRLADSGCCLAIGGAENPKRAVTRDYNFESAAQNAFKRLFRLDSKRSMYYWSWSWPGDLDFESDRCARVLALLFAAEVARTGL